MGGRDGTGEGIGLERRGFPDWRIRLRRCQWQEGGASEVELVDALELEPFGLFTPSASPCLSLRYHIAQKIHGMTNLSAQENVSNERFRDLADVLLLRDLVEDLPAVRAACLEVFAFRGTHAWPPVLEPPAFWEELYTELAAGLELAGKALLEGAP
jgi:hypothetical protein